MLAVPTIASPCIIAKTINVLKIELPPLLISGKVTPVDGIMLIAPPTVKIICIA